MNIYAVPKIVFDSYLQKRHINDSNVESLKDVALISINNTDDPDDILYFKENHSNVKVMTFDDVDKDIEVDNIPLPGSKFKAKALTSEQAKELFYFIKKHSGKKTIIVHCTAGISRSGAVAVFINDYIQDNDWESFKNNNPFIVPNAHVYKLLLDQWQLDQGLPTII